MNKYLREQDPRGLVIEAHNCSSISASIIREKGEVDSEMGKEEVFEGTEGACV